MKLIGNEQVAIVEIEGAEYLNATEVCKRFGRDIRSWRRLKATMELIEAMARHHGVEEDRLVVTIKGGADGQGTFIHRELIIDFAQWISIDFRMQCDAVLKQLLKREAVIATAEDIYSSEARLQEEIILFSSNTLFPFTQEFPVFYEGEPQLGHIRIDFIRKKPNGKVEVYELKNHRLDLQDITNKLFTSRYTQYLDRRFGKGEYTLHFVSPDGWDEDVAFMLQSVYLPVKLITLRELTGQLLLEIEQIHSYESPHYKRIFQRFEALLRDRVVKNQDNIKKVRLNSLTGL